MDQVLSDPEQGIDFSGVAFDAPSEEAYQEFERMLLGMGEQQVQGSSGEDEEWL